MTFLVGFIYRRQTQVCKVRVIKKVMGLRLKKTKNPKAYIVYKIVLSICSSVYHKIWLGREKK